MPVQVLFYLFACVSVIAAFLTITRKNPVISAVWLVVCLFCVAGIYLLLGAYFVAAVQVIVYAGAVLMLFLFVIMMLNLRTGIVGQMRNLGIKLLGVLIALLVFVQLRLAFKGVSLLTGPELSADFGQAASLGKLLFSEYVYPLEVIAVLLLVAVVGALVLTGKESA
ncbi:MAG: NADH-quinone oxidoreductase subunit J [Candidatus Glassbacteria bacterium]|nr:NADH-quinone oxidoreductase subunit J [Candidatus Glassbacteria bacterium]